MTKDANKRDGRNQANCKVQKIRDITQDKKP